MRRSGMLGGGARRSRGLVAKGNGRKGHAGRDRRYDVSCGQVAATRQRGHRSSDRYLQRARPARFTKPLLLRPLTWASRWRNVKCCVIRDKNEKFEPNVRQRRLRLLRYRAAEDPGRLIAGTARRRSSSARFRARGDGGVSRDVTAGAFYSGFARKYIRSASFVPIRAPSLAGPVPGGRLAPAAPGRSE
jgi:hypothetical protein